MEGSKAFYSGTGGKY